MGRTAAHTQEQVFEAADKLAASSQEVTAKALRDLLGRGSYSTFVKQIDFWQQARQAAPAPVILEMPDAVKTAFAQCWQATAGEASREIAGIREKADAEIKVSKRRLEEAIEALEQLESEAEADAGKLEASESALEIERAASQKTATAAAAREAALSATVDQMHRQIEAQQTELSRVHAEAEAARTQQTVEIARLAATSSRQLAEQVAALQASQAEADRLRDQLTDVATKLDAVTARERTLIEDAATARAEVVRLGDQLENQKTHNTEITDQLKAQKTRSMEVIGKLENSKQLLEGELIATRKEAREMTSQLGQATGELGALRTQVAGQTDVIKGFSALPKTAKKLE